MEPRPAFIPLRRSLLFFFTFPLIFGLMLLCGAMRWLDGAGPYDNSANPVDLDSDGDLDVILNNLRHETETIIWTGTTLWYNQGGGRFTPVNLYTLVDQDTPSFSTGADVDRDGDIDLVGGTNNRLVLVLNQDGQYQPHNGTAPPGYHSQYRSVITGDLNNDGQVDGLVAGCCGMNFTNPNDDRSYDAPDSFVWVNDWNPRGWMDFHSLTLPELDNLPVHGAALGDLDGDGDLDLLAAVQQPAEGQVITPGGRVLLNDGTGQFTSTGQRLGEEPALSTALGDLDGDGDIDTGLGTPNGLQVWLNQGAARFVPGPRLDGLETRAVFLADLDGDADLDAVLAGKQEARVWLNDGRATFRRVSQRLRYTERHALTLADFNADGAPDLFAAAYEETYTLWLNNGTGVFLQQTH